MDVNDLILNEEGDDNRHWDEEDMEEIIFEPEEILSVNLVICAVIAGVIALCFIIYRAHKTRITRQPHGRGKNIHV